MQEFRRYYDSKMLNQYLAFLILSIISAKVSDGYSIVAFMPILFIIGLIRRQCLLFAVIFSMSCILCNVYLVPKVGATLLVYRSIVMLIGCAACMAVLQGRYAPSIRTFLWLFVYLVYMIIPSSAGWSPFVSHLKLLLYSLTLACFAYVYNIIITAGPQAASIGRSAILSMLVVYIFGSIAVIPFPSISLLNKYDLTVEELLSNSITLFKGLTLHSQTLGPIIATAFVFLYADLIFNIRRMDKLYLVLLICCPILIYKSGSRTAMGSMILGMMMASYYLLKTRNVLSSWRWRIVRGVGFLALCGIVIVVCSSKARDSVVRFVIKFDTSATSQDVSFDSFTKTRQGKYEETMYHFRQSPLIGNGFQVSEQLAQLDVPITQLISAPVEKGYWVSAVLEEGGIVGMVIFCGYLLFVWFKLSGRGCYTTVSVFITMIVSNIGEFTFFSLTAAGGFHWLLVLGAAMVDEARLKENQAYFGANG